MIMAADPQGNITEYNPAASLRFGYEAEEVIGRDTRMLYAESTEYRSRAARTGTSTACSPERCATSTRMARCSPRFLAASRLYDEDGRLLGAMGVTRDITIMKRDQEALKASEERYRDLFENATDLIQSVDAEGRFEYVNTAWKDTLGIRGRSLQRITIWDIVHPDELRTLPRFLRPDTGR